MNRFASMALSGMLASTLVLTGCAGQATSGNTGEESTTSSSKEQTSTVAGGWTTCTEAAPAIADDVRAYWDKAMEGYTGVSFEPVRVLATQVVAGRNYAILARGTTTTSSPSTDYYVVTMYVDPEGNASVTSANKIDLADVKVVDETSGNATPSGNVMSGWTVPNPENSVLEPEDAKKTFDKAREAYVGAELYPIATLGTQVVAGTNYLVLCTSVPVEETPTNGLAVAKVYADLNGNAQVTELNSFDLLAYVG